MININHIGGIAEELEVRTESEFETMPSKNKKKVKKCSRCTII